MSNRRLLPLPMLLLCAARIAQAQQPCEKRSLRTDFSLPPPDPALPAPAAVALVQGETLCLELHGPGTALRPAVVLRSPAAVRATLHYGDGQSVLELANLGQAPLWFSVSDGTVGQQPLLPGRTSRTTRRGWVPSLNLEGFTHRQPAAHMRRQEDDIPAPDADEPSPRAFWIGISLIYSLHFNNQTALNRSFRENGYGPAGNTQPIFGFAFDLGRRRWRVAADLGCWANRYYERIDDGERYRVNQCFMGPTRVGTWCSTRDCRCSPWWVLRVVTFA